MDMQKLTDFIALKVFTKAEAVFEIGGKEFRMTPMTPKKLTNLLSVLEAGGKDLKLDDFNQSIGTILDRVVDTFPLVFNAPITKEFAEEYLTIPLAKEIFEQFVKLNCLEGFMPFFQKAISVKMTAEPLPQKEIKKETV